MRDRRIGELLRDLPVPEEDAARDRALRVVRAARAEEATPIPRHPARRLGLALAAATLVSALLLSPAGAKVRGWVGDVVTGDSPSPAPALTALPGGGRLLVESAAGPWVVGADGSQRLLGSYGEATWSPRGLYVAVADGTRLTAVEPDGDPRWTVTGSRVVSSPRWSPSGFRIAYRAGDSLRIVAGDGTGDALLARRTLAAPPAWRPGSRHVLAYLDEAGRATVIDVDSRRVLFSTGPDPTRFGLDWSSDGRRLLVLSPTQLLKFDGRGRSFGDVPHPVRARLSAAAFEPGTHRIAEIVHYSQRALRSGSEVTIVTPGSQRLIFSAPQELGDLTWSPDAKRLLVSWRRADQWAFIPVRGGRTRSVGDIRRQFAPGVAHPAFPSIDGWCCPG